MKRKALSAAPLALVLFAVAVSCGDNGKKDTQPANRGNAPAEPVPQGTPPAPTPSAAPSPVPPAPTVGTSPAPTDATVTYEAVAPILQKTCVQGCHSATGIQKRHPFETKDQVIASAATMKARIEDGSMPPGGNFDPNERALVLTFLANPTATPTPSTPVATPVATTTPVATPVATTIPVATPVATTTPVATPVATSTPVATPVATATPGGTVGPQTPLKYSDVSEIIQKTCGAGCHTATGIEKKKPFDTLEQVKKYRSQMTSEIEGGDMPPDYDSLQRKLEGSDRQKLLDWLASGSD